MNRSGFTCVILKQPSEKTKINIKHSVERGREGSTDEYVSFLSSMSSS